ncbi:MAG: IPT/TIG domain-containing protein, partial [Burkholderiaceae bacterium]|nr:IPT/TIG domain-containing protein [Burkholderiaceae bacterium]
MNKPSFADVRSWRNRMGRLVAGVGLLCAAAMAHANLSDDFQRADGAALGNGWIEKTPAAFSIQSGAVAKVAAGNGYLDNLVYRPAVEDVRDVEASVELRLLAASPGYPQIHVRIQSAGAALAGWLDSYILYVDGDNTRAVLGRQRGSAFVAPLATITIAPALNTADTFRLRLRAVGTSPVQLAAFVERLAGGSWQVIGQAAVNDLAPDRITAAGAVGFSGYIETAYRYDNFVRTNLTSPPPTDPTPQLASLAPHSATIGSTATTVTISGSNFTSSSVARWNGQPRTTTFVSSSELRVSLLAADLASDAIGAVTVANGAVLSAPLSFFVLPATDTVFFDGFNRGPAQDVGNGWIEKMPSAFQILTDGVLWADDTAPFDFHDAIVYRPLSEAQLDVETGVEFTRAAGARFPQVHARIQGNTVGLPDTLHSYILYVEDGISPTQLAIAVQPPVFSEGECIIRLIPLPSVPAAGVRYRLRFQVRGVYPVQLTG